MNGPALGPGLLVTAGSSPEAPISFQAAPLSALQTSPKLHGELITAHLPFIRGLRLRHATSLTMLAPVVFPFIDLDFLLSQFRHHNMPQWLLI